MNKVAIISVLLFATIFLGFIIRNKGEPRKDPVPDFGLPQGGAQRQETNAPPISSTPTNQPVPIKSAQPIFQVDPFKRTPEEQLVSIKYGVRFNFRKAIKALKLTPEDESKLWDLLIKHSEAAYIAHDVSVERDLAHTPGNLDEIIAIAQSEVKVEIVKTFGEDVSKQVLLMLGAGRYMSVAMGFDVALTQAGDPLNPEQVLPMALIFKETYDSVKASKQLPTLDQINPATGLVPLNETVVSRLAGVLSKHQLETIKDSMAERNLRFLKSKLSD